MFGNLDLSGLFALIAAILDYAVKAVVAFKDTDEGRDEWLDIEAAARRVIGDEEGEANARAEAENIRSNTPVQRRSASAAIAQEQTVVYEPRS